MPVIFALMNAVIPLQIGARDVAFPFLNALGFWTFLFGGLLLNLSWIMGGAPDAGWTSYTPLSSSTYSLTHGGRLLYDRLADRRSRDADRGH
ncbi:hypothetical protein HMSSN139_49660 [Paenibacillus sp. HMSSN-139]|nr:hypothetical protein HMSSN139_49660 [Paenibacillus sp. HMSSN-139]